MKIIQETNGDRDMIVTITVHISPTGDATLEYDETVPVMDQDALDAYLCAVVSAAHILSPDYFDPEYQSDASLGCI